MQTYPWVNIEFESEELAQHSLASLELDGAQESNCLNHIARGRLIQLQPTGTAEWAADFYQKCALLVMSQQKLTLH